MGQGKKESKEKGIRSKRESIKEEIRGMGSKGGGDHGNRVSREEGIGEGGAREEGIMGSGNKGNTGAGVKEII